MNSSLSSWDHRQLNKELKLFLFLPEVGSALPIWLPQGMIVKNLLKNFLLQLETEANFLFLTTPVLAKAEIYQQSGHFAHYQNYIFPSLTINQQKLLLRPMTCPHHCLVFASQNYSYQDLPVRFSENSLLFRYETGGAIHGLERVRQMELKDSHIFLPQDERIIIDEVKKAYNLTSKVFTKLRLKTNQIYLSLPDFSNQKKFHHDQAIWEKGIKILQQALKELAISYQEMKGEAAFYGAKIDFQITTGLNHDITVATIQLDFLLAGKFQLKYRTAHQDASTSFATPVILHHGIIGTYERLLALLLEQNNGWLPFWLVPCQMMIFIVSDDPLVKNYGEKVAKLLSQHHLRVKLAPSHKTLKENVKDAWKKKIPLQLFIGKKEQEAKKLTYFHHHNQEEKFFHTIWQLLNQCMIWNS